MLPLFIVPFLIALGRQTPASEFSRCIPCASLTWSLPHLLQALQLLCFQKLPSIPLLYYSSFLHLSWLCWVASLFSLSISALGWSPFVSEVASHVAQKVGFLFHTSRFFLLQLRFAPLGYRSHVCGGRRLLLFSYSDSKISLMVKDFSVYASLAGPLSGSCFFLLFLRLPFWVLFSEACLSSSYDFLSSILRLSILIKLLLLDVFQSFLPFLKTVRLSCSYTIFLHP